MTLRPPIAVLGALLALDAWAQAKAPAQPAAPPPQTRELQILQKVMPTYDRRGGLADGGCVTVKLVIKPDGFVSDITVLEAKPAELAEPTIVALKQWWFQSFPPPALTTVQTFYFAPEQIRLPDDAIRSPYAVATDEGSLNSQACGGGKVDNAAKPSAPEAAK